MDLREINNCIINKCVLYSRKLNKKFIASNFEKKNGKIWVIGKDLDGTKVRVNIRFVENAEIEHSVNDPIPFPNEKKQIMEENEEKTFEALRLLGRNSSFIKKVFSDEMESAMSKTMMVKFPHLDKPRDATVRTMHYANTCWVALMIARGLFPNDEELARGISICALGHDYGQCPFGHDGEEAARKSLENYNAGSISHNVQGALYFQYRLYNELVSAINEEPIIEAEAKKRLDKNIPIEEYNKKLKEKKNEIRQNIKLRREPEILEKIQYETKNNQDIIDHAVQLIIMSAGNHNGERGTAKIEPDYSKTFDEFYKILQETGVDSKANNKLVPHTIADSISKLADQISSIPFDMIDGVRSGIEDKISNNWVIPVSQILQISEEETREKLNGDNKELVNLAFEIQDKLIESVVRCSNPRKIDMDLDELLYGLNGTIGLRTPNLTEHIIYTSTEEEGILLDNLFSELTDKLVNEIVDKKGLFEPELNSIFRLKSNNQTRRSKVLDLKSNYRGKEEIRDFYNYCVDVSADEYNYHKEIVKKKELEYFRELIVNELETDNDQIYSLPELPPRGTIEFAIKVAMMSGIEKVLKEPNGQYSDASIKKMISNINAFLRNNPVGGIDNLNVTADRTKYISNSSKNVEKRKVTDDQSIAARMAVSYLCKLNDEEFLNLGLKLGLINEDNIKMFKKSYKEYSIKKAGKKGNYGGAVQRTAEDYNHGVKNCNNNENQKYLERDD